MENKEQETRGELIQEYVESHAQETLALLRKLAAIPAPLGREEKRAAFVLDWLHGIGAKEAYIDAVGNVIFPYPCGGRKTAAPGPCDMRDRQAALCTDADGACGGCGGGGARQPARRQGDPAGF